MAEKTIYRAIQTRVTVVPDATVTNLDQITIQIPDTPTSFKSVTAEVAFADVVTATGGTINEHRVGFRLGAAAYTTFTETDDIANSGENIAGLVSPIDMTAHFNTNWTGGSMTFDLQVYFDQNTGTTLGMINVNALIKITYEYDDDPGVNATQIKTARIPLESLVGALPTAANSNFGSNQIPILTGGTDPLLPENSVVIRDYFFVIEGNQQNNNTTTDFQVSVNIDSGTAFPFGITEAALGSDCYQRLIWIPSAVPDTTIAHNFQIWSSVANKMNHVTVTLYVTYEFAPAASTRLNQSIIIPVEIASPLGISTSANMSRFVRDLMIADPGTIVMKQSAFRINFNTTGAVAGLNFRAGGQAFRTYTNLGVGVCGMYSLQQRIDSGSAQGAGMTIARGKNTITIDGYATDTTDQVTNINGYILLNYIADKPASGRVGDNAHTIEKLLYAWNALLQDRVRVDGYSFSIAPTNYWAMSVGFLLTLWQSTAANAITFDVEANSGEGKGAGYYDIYADALQTDAERGCTQVYMRGRDVFKRYPADPDPDRLDIETARSYRLYNAATAGVGLEMIVTHHAHTFTSTLNITNSAGGTVDVDIFRVDNDEKILSLSRVGNGTIDATWYDNTLDVYAVARESDVLLSRSENFKFGD